MDTTAGTVNSLQASLRELNLQPKEEGGTFTSHNVLLGKVLSTRNFRRYMIMELIARIWQVKTKIQIEKLKVNVFKFGFGNKEDMAEIFKNWPWSFNGAHLIL